MKVSVCIPVYGVEKYIERCARSLFEQTMREDIEFIFVDDCTPDKSIDILQKVLEEYPARQTQVKIIRHEVNKGLTGARNTALRHASGEYIIHCDSDDWVASDMYETLYSKANAENADLVCCSFALEYDNSQPVIIKLPDSLQDLIDCNLHWSLVTKLVRASIALRPDTYSPDDLCYSEDLLRSVQIFTHVGKVVFINEAFYHYYQGNRYSYSKTFKKIFLDQQIRIVSWLEENQNRFSLLSIKGDILFHGVVRGLFAGDEVRNLWQKEHKQIVCYHGLHWVKRCVVFSAFISYPVTVWLCRHLFAKRYGLKKKPSLE